jgi:hypothetical protein
LNVGGRFRCQKRRQAAALHIGYRRVGLCGDLLGGILQFWGSEWAWFSTDANAIVQLA